MADAYRTFTPADGALWDVYGSSADGFIGGIDAYGANPGGRKKKIDVYGTEGAA